ncbi:hypothetical protein CHUAL_013456 [Chamberlinius hualienensis]
MENVTIESTPIPKAASTHVNNDRLRTLRSTGGCRLNMSSFGSGDESSLGILSTNFTDLNTSTSRSSKRSSRPPTLPSVTENPDSSNIEASVENISDEVFTPSAHRSLPIETENCEGNSERLSRCSKDFSISDLTNIEFCDQQISARSSIAENSDSDPTKREKSNQAKPMYTSVLLSNVLRRHTLDVSEFIPTSTSYNVPNRSESTETKTVELDFSKSVDESVNDEVLVGSRSFQPVSDNVLNFFSGFVGQHDKDFSGFDGNFTNDVKELLDRDEAAFEAEHRFSIPVIEENKNTPDEPVVTDTYNHDSDNWRNSMQDITRPSWISEEVGSRISIGKLFAARATSIDSGLGDLGKDLKVDIFGKNNDTCADQTYGLSKLVKLPVIDDININSKFHEEVSALLDDMSVSDDTQLMTERMLAVVSKNVIPSTVKQTLPSTKFTKVSCATILTPIPSVSEAISPVPPSDVLSKMDKSLDEKLPSPTKQDDEIDYQPCSPVVQSCTVSPTQHFLSLQEANPLLGGVNNSEQVIFPTNEYASECQSGVMNYPMFVGSSNTPLNNLPSMPYLFQLKSSTKTLPFEVLLSTSVEFNACCVGISTESSIKMQNESIHWLEGCYKILSVKCDGREWISSNSMPVFSIPQSWDLEPNSTLFLDVVFCPARKGRWEAHIQFYFRGINSCSNGELTSADDVKDGLKWESSSVVKLEGIAEAPNLILSPKDQIDFGIVTEESLTVKHIQITSKTQAQFPIRLVIDESYSRGVGYYFPNESGRFTQSRNFISVCCKSETELTIPVAFKAPKNTSQMTGGYFQLHSAVLRVDVDGIGPNPVLATVPLSATVGAVRLFTPIKNETIHLNLSFATSYTFPLYNLGGVPLKLQLTTEHPQNFSVVPDKVMIMPGGRNDVRAHYHPLDLQNPLQSSVQIKIYPGGSLFEIQIIGNPHSTQSQHVASVSQNDVHLHCDRRAVFWGTVGLGQEIVQQVSLRNTFATETLNLVLIIKMSNENDERTFSFNEHNGSSTKTLVTLSPGQQSNIQLKFLPLSRKKYHALLIIKPQSHLTGILLKFTIPLVGYGGVSLVRLFGLNQELPLTQIDDNNSLWSCENYSVLCSKLRNGFSMVIRNDGDRSTYVSMVHSLDAKSYAALPSWMQASVKPSSFVLSPSSNTTVSWSFKITDQRRMCDFYLIISTLDDVLWQRCMMLRKKGFFNRVPRNSHFMEQFLFNSRFSLPDCADSEIDASNLPCQDELNRLFSSMKLFCIKVKSAGEDQGFVTLRPEETFTEATYNDGENGPNVLDSQTSSEDSSIPTVDSCLRVSSTTVVFPETKVNEVSVVKLRIENHGKHDCPVTLKPPEDPFMVKQSGAVIKANHYLSLPLRFQPTRIGVFKSHLRIQSIQENSLPSFCISLHGNSI